MIQIKEYLLKNHREIPQDDIKKCKDKESLIALVTSRCSIAQCSLLYFMAEHFNQKQALKHINAYNKYKEQIYSEIKAAKFSKALLHKQEFDGEIQVIPQYSTCRFNPIFVR